MYIVSVAQVVRVVPVLPSTYVAAMTVVNLAILPVT